MCMCVKWNGGPSPWTVKIILVKLVCVVVAVVLVVICRRSNQESWSGPADLSSQT